MTKKEMVYEMISYTKFKGLNQTEIDKIISKTSKKRIKEVYSFFTNNRDKAHFCLACLGT